MVKVFYSSKMVANTSSTSPSPSKPGRVVASWLRKFSGIEIVEPEPVTLEQLCLAHDPAFVQGVLECRIPNGFGNKDAEVARSLPYTSGAMLGAGREAIRNGKVAVAPCSGFHHACWAKPMGYCSFNGLMVTAMVLKNEGMIGEIGILDCDNHYGNGTDNIIEQLKLNWVNHFTAGEEYCYSHQIDDFFREIPRVARSMTDCDLILYQAGADPHKRDPLGGWMSTEQLQLRDRMVFETFAELGVPVAWNLAGGYQTPFTRVLEIHDNTMQECLAVYDKTS